MLENCDGHHFSLLLVVAPKQQTQPKAPGLKTMLHAIADISLYHVSFLSKLLPRQLGPEQLGQTVRGPVIETFYGVSNNSAHQKLKEEEKQYYFWTLLNRLKTQLTVESAKL